MTSNVAKCLLVSKVLVADGMVTDDERAFLDGIMRKLGLTEGERRQVIELEGLDAALPIVQELPVDEKRALLDMLVDAASADGRLSKLELGAVRRLADALGVDH